MKMIMEHLSEIIIALVISAMLFTAIFILREPMGDFFDRIGESVFVTGDQDDDGT